ELPAERLEEVVLLARDRDDVGRGVRDLEVRDGGAEPDERADADDRDDRGRLLHEPREPGEDALRGRDVAEPAEDRPNAGDASEDAWLREALAEEREQRRHEGERGDDAQRGDEQRADADRADGRRLEEQQAGGGDREDGAGESSRATRPVDRASDGGD